MIADKAKNQQFSIIKIGESLSDKDIRFKSLTIRSNKPLRNESVIGSRNSSNHSQNNEIILLLNNINSSKKLKGESFQRKNKSITSINEAQKCWICLTSGENLIKMCDCKPPNDKIHLECFKSLYQINSIDFYPYCEHCKKYFIIVKQVELKYNCRSLLSLLKSKLVTILIFLLILTLVDVSLFCLLYFGFRIQSMFSIIGAIVSFAIICLGFFTIILIKNRKSIKLPFLRDWKMCSTEIEHLLRAKACDKSIPNFQIDKNNFSHFIIY